MTDRIVYLDPDPHATVRKLLPWYVNGRLDAIEHAEVEAHLATCPVCRSELEFEQTLQTSIRTSDQLSAFNLTDTDTDAGWARMLEQVDAGSPPRRSRPEAAAQGPSSPSTRPSMHWFSWGRVAATSWAAPALLSIALALALLITVGLPDRSARDYHALAAPVEEGATAVVRFRPEATEAQIRRSLNDSGARLVDGPTVSDAYIVRLPRDRYAAALDALRRQPSVTLVEALESAGAR